MQINSVGPEANHSNFHALPVSSLPLGQQCLPIFASQTSPLPLFKLKLRFRSRRAANNRDRVNSTRILRETLNCGTICGVGLNLLFSLGPAEEFHFLKYFIIIKDAKYALHNKPAYIM